MIIYNFIKSNIKINTDMNFLQYINKILTMTSMQRLVTQDPQHPQRDTIKMIPPRVRQRTLRGRAEGIRSPYPEYEIFSQMPTPRMEHPTN